MIVTEPNPVSVAVGYDPTSPVIVVVPVLVIPEYARTANGAAVPRFTVGMTAEAGWPPYTARIPTTRRKEAAIVPMLFLVGLDPFCITIKPFSLRRVLLRSYSDI